MKPATDAGAGGRGANGPARYSLRHDSLSAPGGVYAGRVEMKMLARIIEIYLKRAFPGAAQAEPADPLPVIDETGLAGLYDVRVDLRQNGDWLTALEGQLGLKQERRKSPVEVLVIDRAERPAGN